MKKNLGILLISGLLTSGCMPTLFLAGAAAGGAVLYEKRDPKVILHDMQLAPQAKAVFDQASEFHGQSNLQFHSYNESLLITGEVSSIPLQKRVDVLAHTVPLAKRVFNQTHVTPTRPKHHDLKDTWITTQAKSILIAQEGVHSNSIKVITHDHIVYLMGAIPKSQMDLAAYTVSQIHGVTKVIELVDKKA